MPIGSKIKALRLQAGLTQAQVAEAAGFLQSVLARYELDKGVPSGPRLAAIAKALGVTVEEILDESALPPASEPKPHIHGNSRAAKIQELFLQLDDETQRVVLKQVKALIQPRTDTTEPKRPRKAA